MGITAWQASAGHCSRESQIFDSSPQLPSEGSLRASHCSARKIRYTVVHCPSGPKTQRVHRVRPELFVDTNLDYERCRLRCCWEVMLNLMIYLPSTVMMQMLEKHTRSHDQQVDMIRNVQHECAVNARKEELQDFVCKIALCRHSTR